MGTTIYSETYPQNEVLIIPKGRFIKELDKRLEIGETLHQQSIFRSKELADSIKEFKAWNELNAEILAKSFDRPTNGYYLDYTRAESPYGDFGIHYSVEAKVKKYKSQVKKKILELRSIQESSMLVKVDTQLARRDMNKNRLNTLKTIVLLKGIFCEERFLKKIQIDQLRYHFYWAYYVDKGLIKSFAPLLFQKFEDVLVERYSSYCSRIDFIQRKGGVVIIFRSTYREYGERAIKFQLKWDIRRYCDYPVCKNIVLLIYDRESLIKNRAEFIWDITHLPSDGLNIAAIIQPTNYDKVNSYF